MSLFTLQFGEILHCSHNCKKSERPEEEGIEKWPTYMTDVLGRNGKKIIEGLSKKTIKSDNV
jgi:hypothetical protein